ncbi:MAG: membrane-bound lytic murein transglycosylase MltF [Thiobacillus sp.]
MPKQIATVLLLAWALHACTEPPPPAPEKTSELVVSTRQGPGTYYINHAGKIAGFEYDLVSAFARKEGWAVRWDVRDNTEAVISSIETASAHFAAAGLTESMVHARLLRAGPMLFETPVLVVYRNGKTRPTNPASLSGKKIAILENSGLSLIMLRLKLKLPGLTWQNVDAVWPEELLARLDHGEYDAVLVNSMDFELARNAFPNLAVAFALDYKQKIVWALPRNTSPELVGKLESFISEARKNETLKRIYERYYGHTNRLNNQDVLGILDRRKKLLPKLRRHFHEAQTLTGIDWRLLAAIGYQESKWDPNATSPTGVRGLMMLTGDTADRMGVQNRLDARQSILGGARYLVLMKKTLPRRIPEPDRTWIALAAYNQGQGHMEDARRIAQARGDHPDHWADVKESLPLLSRGGYENVMRYGGARGGEALIFTENIRAYYDILLRTEREYRPLFNLGSGDDTPGES